MKQLTSIIVIFMITSLGLAQKNNTKHDLSCYDNGTLAFHQLEGAFLEGVEIKLDEELEVGKAVFDEMANKYTIKTSGPQYEKVLSIMNRLTAQIAKFNNPTSHVNFGKYKSNYKIYIIETEEINAFTAGARIFVTTGIYEFCKNDSELASIIGHELSHNELGHIANHVKRQKAAQGIFGGFAGIAYMAGQVLTMPFGQTDEGHCDLFGMDLSKSAGFAPCYTIDLWERMAEQSGEKTFFNLFSSHPYSGDRATCAGNHLKVNYKLNCNN